MKKSVVAIFSFMLLFSSTAYAQEARESASGNGWIIAGSILTGIGLVGMASKDSGGSRSSATFEAQKVSPLVVLAGVSLIVIGNKKKSHIGISMQDSQPMLTFAHSF